MMTQQVCTKSVTLGLYCDDFYL